MTNLYSDTMELSLIKQSIQFAEKNAQMSSSSTNCPKRWNQCQSPTPASWRSLSKEYSHWTCAGWRNLTASRLPNHFHRSCQIRREMAAWQHGLPHLPHESSQIVPILLLANAMAKVWTVHAEIAAYTIPCRTSLASLSFGGSRLPWDWSTIIPNLSGSNDSLAAMHPPSLLLIELLHEQPSSFGKRMKFQGLYSQLYPPYQEAAQRTPLRRMVLNGAVP